MVDLCPAVLVLLAVAYHAVLLAPARHTPVVPRSRPYATKAAMVGVVLFLAPYLAYAALPGDPDVWDFYRSAWFVPLGVALCVGATAAVRAAGRRCTVARRLPARAHRPG